MGGGWTSSRAAQQRRDLIARSAAAADTDEGLVDEEPPPRPAGGRRQHCWVVMGDVDPMPGVVAAWERTEAGSWQARVSYVLGDATGGVVTGWLPATLLRPYDGEPSPPR